MSRCTCDLRRSEQISMHMSFNDLTTISRYHNQIWPRAASRARIPSSRAQRWLSSRVESSRVRVEHRTGLPCSKLEIIEFDRAEGAVRLELDMLSLCVLWRITNPWMAHVTWIFPLKYISVDQIWDGAPAHGGSVYYYLVSFYIANSAACSAHSRN